MHLSINRQFDRQVMRILDLALFDSLGDWKESIKSLGDTPRQTLLLGFLLSISCRHIDGETVGLYRVKSARMIVWFQVRQRFAHDQSEFNFIVKIYSTGSNDRS